MHDLEQKNNFLTFDARADATATLIAPGKTMTSAVFGQNLSSPCGNSGRLFRTKLRWTSVQVNKKTMGTLKAAVKTVEVPNF